MSRLECSVLFCMTKPLSARMLYIFIFFDRASTILAYVFVKISRNMSFSVSLSANILH